ncbi:sensor histidine kinase [Aquipseudomonas alcaligenes]|uniref:Uncharacterized protein n=1 Tax=Aquipseudomonas alcaligenes (strain ATCC 14909 / DSM 50342 / CCUG 1425 / JCM 20561 / NBRC 14159 / NCIMB 9945 / NCTC 10367 / 1577) TaxID=1215092 RepID=U3B518_AQUA1|nr:sensor histidine kinase [Pseudomonas alcaligenes]GAD61993.1 hypothetical protein PA6_008_02000 [Pseudomonas alcaligenes NBRC 14159]SUD13218.1 Uncharacterised protein [Pseudomonas alcaligenes]
MSKNIVIKIPSILDLQSSLKMSIDLASISDVENIAVDFSGVGHVEPFAMLVASSEIQRAVARNRPAKFECRNHEKMTYAAHMGFFKAFGIDFGNNPGQAKGSSRYLPLTILKCDELRHQALTEGTEVGNIIEEKSKHLASMLCNGASGDIHDTLSYSLREIMRNVVEHSEASQIGICAQYWPTQHKVEVAIIDRGVGLRTTLSRNPHLDVSSDKSAINYALMPAVSGRAFKGSRTRQRGPWANSGFGLYMTSRICRNGGNFFIASGDTGMLLTKATEGKRYFSCSYSATAVRLVIKTDQIISLAESLKSYREDGYKIQSKYREIVNINPSAASLMLSEDFDLSVWEKIISAFSKKQGK